MTEKTAKQTTPLKLADIAQELRRVADELEKQKFNTGSGTVDVGELTFLKTRRELKNHTAYFSLSLKMAVGGTDNQVKPDRHTKTAKPSKPRTSGSSEAKKIKKEINRLWKTIRKQIETREQPDQTDAKTLLKLWEDYTIFTEAVWSKAWTDCKVEIEKCLRQAADNQWPEAESTAQKITLLTKECHRQHK